MNWFTKSDLEKSVERDQFLEQNPEFESYEIEFQQYLEGREDATEINGKVVELEGNTTEIDEIVLRGIEDASEVDEEELLSVYLQALGYAQNAVLIRLGSNYPNSILRNKVMNNLPTQ